MSEFRYLDKGEDVEAGKLILPETVDSGPLTRYEWWIFTRTIIADGIAGESDYLLVVDDYRHNHVTHWAIVILPFAWTTTTAAQLGVRVYDLAMDAMAQVSQGARLDALPVVILDRVDGDYVDWQLLNYIDT